MEVTLTGPDLAVRTATRRLVQLLDGAELRVPRPAAAPDERTYLLTHAGDGEDLRVDVAWYGPAALEHHRPGGEAAVQAMSGLMRVHGRDAGIPRRLGLEVASVAAGVLAAQAVLSSAVGRARGRVQTRAETSVLEAALQITSHYVAAATCHDLGEWRQPKAGPAPGPPFRSADGRWFEIETLDPDAWRRFWGALGASDLDLSGSWTQFRSRYFRGACTLTAEVHEATTRHRIDEITSIARDCRVSLALVREYDDVLADPRDVSELAWLEATETTHDTARGHPVPSQRGGLPLEGVVVVEATSR
ncbi:MAG: CoA transferase, partial [Candidatus Dormibacteria bacterium]